MRKARVGFMLAVALLAVLAAAFPASQAHAAPNITTACTSTHWVIYGEAFRSNGGYSFDYQVFELRDAGNAYCGKLYTRVGVSVPAHGGPGWTMYLANETPGGIIINEPTLHVVNPYPLYPSGPYWVGSSGDQFSHSLGSGIVLDGIVRDWTLNLWETAAVFSL